MGSFGRQLARVNVLWRDEVISKWNLGPYNVFKWKKAATKLSTRRWGVCVGGWYRRWEILKDPWHRGKTWMPTNRLRFLAGVLAQSKHICKTRVLLSFARWHQRSGGSVVLPRAASDKAPHCAVPFVKSFPVSSRKTPTWEYDNMKCHIEGLLWNWAPRALWYSILGICLTLRLG